MLEGLKVVEMASMIAGPAAAGLLADWGASVIKVEAHSGDGMRGGPNSPLGVINFDLHNRGKRDIALNTSAPETREVVLRLVKDCDLFITNILPAQLEKLRLTFEDLHPVNPRMVYGSVSSFGREGPDRDRGATDNLGFWARGGGTGLLTVEGQDPIPIRQSVGDRMTGMTALSGMLAALVSAKMTGQGRFIDTSLLSTGMWAFSTDISNQLNKGRVAVSKNRHGAVFALSNYFKTRDGRWLQLHTDLPTVAKALDRPDLLDDPRFAGRRMGRAETAELVDVMDAIFATFDYADVKTRLEAAGARSEPVQTPADIVQDPQAIATGRFVEVLGQDGPQRQVANPWTVYENGQPIRRTMGPVPKLGEHTIEILTELGYGDADITRMRGSGAILPDA